MLGFASSAQPTQGLDAGPFPYSCCVDMPGGGCYDPGFAVPGAKASGHNRRAGLSFGIHFSDVLLPRQSPYRPRAPVTRLQRQP
ncbi:hypothetical protein D3C78_854410 [compost metagenome]